jgi:hypothetical protein
MLTYTPQLNRQPVFLSASFKARCILELYGRLTGQHSQWVRVASLEYLTWCTDG